MHNEKGYIMSSEGSMNELVESTAQFSFRIDGGNEIDASVLGKTISDIAELTRLATLEEDSEAYIKMNVTAF